MPLIKELITIPERVHQGDFVLKLSEGVAHAEQTLRDYVVTPQLADAFGNALGFIEQAVLSGSSKAAYLHGSFGSGKSHFMAVLNLLLAGNTQARAIPELADAVAKTGWTQGRRFLMVPYHMIGALDMESAILGQYAEHVRRLYPQAPIPGFYRADDLFADAQGLRERLGDAAFFAKLNEGRGGGGWGALDAGWDANSFAAAMIEPPHGVERGRLVGDLIGQFFSAYRSLANNQESFVPLDEGLAIMTRHARDLGYDAVILFLDELVLWLASHAADAAFVSREGTKLVKLVEATHADRPIPLVSFVARQRDLRELVGDHLPGAVGVQFTDVLRHWEARFHRITLEDRNLPAIAEKRVLRPVDENARQTLTAAFDDVLRLRRDVFDTLLTTSADRDMFRKVYPFSPALVQTLIAVSAALQRERTALKLMLQLLVDRRDDLELGQLIPVGDLWDAIADGDEPFSEGMRLQFDNAKRLYRLRLLPMLEAQHGVTWEAVKQGKADGTAARNLRNDARLLKTLLLAALVPEVESLKALTPLRLAALNHGTFRSPIQGQEAQQVTRKLRNWAGEIGEIKVIGDNNPLISIELSGVDLEPVVANARGESDNVGNRRKKIRELLFEQLGLPDSGGLFLGYDYAWRGTKREVELLYANVREMRDDELKGRTDAWSVVIDFPFDDPNRTPADDLARLAEYRGGSTRTLVWLPSFLSQKAQDDLGRYVVLDYLLQGERFDQHAGHLSVVDRAQARTLAKNQRDSLRVKLRSFLEVAYGLASQPQDAVAHHLAPDQQFRSLDPTLAPKPPVGADFKAGFENLLNQLFAHQYPAHPTFDTEVKAAALRTKVWPELRAAIDAPEHRWLIADAALRRLVRSIVDPLQLGRTGETHLIVDTHWVSHFMQRMAQDSTTAAALTVRRLREWIDQPRPMGLPFELQNLVILAFAALTNRRFELGGAPYDAEVDSLPDDVVLREQVLPAQADWQEAVRRASAVFGLVTPQSLNAANVGKLTAALKNSAQNHRKAIADLVDAVAERAQRYAAGAPSARQRSAESAMALLDALTAADDSAVIATLASASFDTSETAVERTIGQAAATLQALKAANWTLFDAVRQLGAQGNAAAQTLADGLAELLRHDEHVIPLKTRIEELERDAVSLLASVAPARPEVTPTVPVHPVQPLPVTPLAAKKVVVEEQQQADLDATSANALLDELKARLAQDAELELTLHWRLQRKEASA